jgi:hypothetical protein
MSSTQVVPRPPDEGGSALTEFLKHTSVYGTRAVIPRELLQYGVYGSLALVVIGVLGMVVASPTAIAHSGFFWILGHVAADVMSVIQPVAVPAMVLGFALLILDVFLMLVPSSEHWRWAVVGQAAAGGVGGVFGTIFLALVIINLAIWIAIGILVLALTVGMLAVVVGALGDG